VIVEKRVVGVEVLKNQLKYHAGVILNNFIILLANNFISMYNHNCTRRCV
jgi:hypothetical protein